MAYQFICYSRRNEEFAFWLYDSIQESEGQNEAWIDQRNIPAGVDWDDEITDALRDCGTLVYLMSRDSVSRESQCKMEWTYALHCKKPIIPLLIEDIPAMEIPRRLMNHQRIDFTGPRDDGLRQLVDHFKWLRSPKGEVYQVRLRLQYAEAVLRKPQSEEERARGENEIKQLEQSLEELSRVANDPTLAARLVSESIKSGMERERTSEEAPRGTESTKFIGKPPGDVPEHFQDRTAETQMMGKFLRSSTQRLFTLVARGGMGKTAVVCRLLKSLQNGQLPDDGGPMEVDGIVYLSFVGSNTVSLGNIFSGLSQLLDADKAEQLESVYKDPHISADEKMSKLLEAIEGECVVLMLDNFEDALDSESGQIVDRELADAICALLESPQHAVKTIVTTRVFPSELATVQPPRQLRRDMDEGLPSPYAENILREMDVDGSLGMKEADARVLAEAKERTLGNPRALEALYGLLSADRDSSLKEILNNTQRVLPEKVTVHIVGEAYSRLDARSQKVMQSLAIYTKPAAPVALDFLLQPFVAAIDSAPIISRLVNMKFVRKESGRYYLHPVDRDYVLARIPQGEPSDARLQDDPPFSKMFLYDRAADYFRQTSKPRESWRTIADLSAQLSEFDMRYKREDYESALNVARGIGFNYLFNWGHFQVMLEMHKKLVGKLSGDDLIASNCSILGITYHRLAMENEAISNLQEALEIGRKRENLNSQAVNLSNLGECYGEIGQIQRSLELYQEAMDIDQRVRDLSGVRADLGNMGERYAELGDTEQSLLHHGKAYEIGKLQVRPRGVGPGRHLIKAASTYVDLEDFEKAHEYLDTGSRLIEKSNDESLKCDALRYRTYAHLLSGRFDAAQEAAERAAAIDLPLLQHRVLILLGIAAVSQNDKETARATFQNTIRRCDTMLARCSELVSALDAKGLALCGLMVCTEEDHQQAAIDCFREARRLTQAKGIVQRIERLFSTLAQRDTANRLADISKVITVD